MSKTRKIEPYLCFEGRCDEAIAFYQKALGAEVLAVMRFKDSPEPNQCSSGSEDKVMHSAIRIGESILMMSDGRCSGKPNFEGISLSVTAADEAESAKLFGALSEGGNVIMPLGKTFYSPSFGMTTDRFGVMWMVIVMSETCG
jgi:PhnB protein